MTYRVQGLGAARKNQQLIRIDHDLEEEDAGYDDDRDHGDDGDAGDDLFVVEGGDDDDDADDAGDGPWAWSHSW